MPRCRQAARLCHSQTFPAGTTSVSYPGIPAGTYYVRVTAANPCGGVATSPDAVVVVTPPVEGARTPNPPAPTPPNYLPLPNRSAVVDEMARLYPGELRNSCGNNTWLFRLVQRLRQEDTRWGLNWKRSRVGDMSQDAVTYNYGPQADEGTRYVHVVDVIGGHCGGNPVRGVDRPDHAVVHRRHLDPAALHRRRLPAVGSGTLRARRLSTVRPPAGEAYFLPGISLCCGKLRLAWQGVSQPAPPPFRPCVVMVAPFALADWGAWTRRTKDEAMFDP